MSATSPPARDLLSSLWRFLASRRLFLVLVLFLTLALIISTAVRQIPDSFAITGPAEYARLLAELTLAYGTLGPILQSLGFFDLGQTLWFRVLLALLVLHCLVRMADQVILWRHLRNPAPDAPLPASGLALEEVRVAAPLATVITLLQTELGSRFAHVVRSEPTAGTADGMALAGLDDETAASSQVTPVTSESTIHATRGALGAVGNALSYLGPVLVLLAFFVTQYFGWRIPGLQLAPGQQLSLARQPDVTIAAPAVDATSQLSVTRSSQVQTPTLAPGRPARVGPIGLYQTGTGAALRVVVQNRAGRPIPLRPLVGGAQADEQQILFQQPQEEISLAVPLRSLVLRFVHFAALPEQGFPGPVTLAQAFAVGEDEPVFSEFITQTGAFTIGDDTYSFTPARYVQIDAVYDPGLWLALLGGFVTFIGLALFAGRAPARAWAWLAGRGDETVATLAVLGSGPATRQELAALVDPVAGLAALHARPMPATAEPNPTEAAS